MKGGKEKTYLWAGHRTGLSLSSEDFRLDQWFSAVTTILDSLGNLNENSGNSLEVLWLELGASTAIGMIQSLLRKLRAHTAGCMVWQKKN